VSGLLITDARLYIRYAIEVWITDARLSHEMRRHAVCVCVCVFVYICMYICMYIYTHICIYIYIYTYTHTHTHTLTLYARLWREMCVHRHHTLSCTASAAWY